MKIGYLDECHIDYVASLKQAQDLESLIKHVSEFRLIGNDAYESVMSKDFNWDEFVAGRKSENNNIYVGDEWALKYGAILMPEIVLKVGIYALEYQAPFGVTYIRLKEFGIIKKIGTHTIWIDPEN
jgi:hypothetical protein